ncbi:hypothetical protein IMZ48_28650 [Candidatus Bathyarchaeota archaeon]|nr:hypothetical protein [Candidatus Bathyarchaeota archaeon]
MTLPALRSPQSERPRSSLRPFPRSGKPVRHLKSTGCAPLCFTSGSLSPGFSYPTSSSRIIRVKPGPRTPPRVRQAAMDDPSLQLVSFTGPNGTTMSIPIDVVDLNTHVAINTCINYGSQLGASIMMLLVVLAMNPTTKLLRAYTAVQVAALAVNVVRMVLLSLYWPSRFWDFYPRFTGDYTSVPASEYHVSAAANTMSLLVNVLIEACLIMQAWAMVKLWSDVWKWAAAVSSALMSLTTIGFRFAFCVIQNRAISGNIPPNSINWVPQAAISTAAASIFWYCALFNMQLVTHLVKNRTFLPTTSGLTPMEALAVSNGILMVIPGKRHPTPSPRLPHLLANGARGGFSRPLVGSPPLTPSRTSSRVRQFAVAKVDHVRGRLRDVHRRRRHPPAGQPGRPTGDHHAELQPLPRERLRLEQ